MADEKLIGTCKYVITEDGTLVISPVEGTTGQLYLEDASGRWPWNGSDIKKVRVDGQIMVKGSAEGMFDSCAQLKDISDLAKMNVRNVKKHAMHVLQLRFTQ